MTPRDNTNLAKGEISVTFLRYILEGLEALGADCPEILRACGIDPDCIADSEARITRSAYDQLWPTAMKSTGDASIGLHVGDQIHPRALNILGYLLMSSSTVGEGLSRIDHYHRVITGERMVEVKPHGGSVTVRLLAGTRPEAALASHTEYVSMVFLKTLDWITRPDFKAAEVRFAHAPIATESEYRRIYQCPVVFRRAASEIQLSDASVALTSVHANPDIARIHAEFAERQLAELTEGSFARQVSMILVSFLEVGSRDLVAVAGRLHMTPRSLQRRLAGEGTTFLRILERLRRELCLGHLALGSEPLAEIAYLAGFADASSFNRAVRRWTGQTPLGYRESKRA